MEMNVTMCMHVTVTTRKTEWTDFAEIVSHAFGDLTLVGWVTGRASSL